MESLEAELDRAIDLDVDELADAIESFGFECTRCGACCKGTDAGDEHVATVFPDEIRRLQAAAEPAKPDDGTNGRSAESLEWRDVARPMPYGLSHDSDGPTGETFEWALQTDDCGTCAFYAETDGVGACTVHEDRPLVCQTYPFSLALGGTSQPLGAAVDSDGLLRAHECEGLGREIDRPDAERLARTLRARAIRELEEAIAVRDGYDPEIAGTADAVVFDSEGPKDPDGQPL